MTVTKKRLTVTVDPRLVAAATAAVKAGQAESVSAWVNEALADRAAKERRLAALAELVAEWEAEHGVISPARLDARKRADRREAIIVRGSGSTRRRPHRRVAA